MRACNNKKKSCISSIGLLIRSACTFVASVSSEVASCDVVERLLLLELMMMMMMMIDGAMVVVVLLPRSHLLMMTMSLMLPPRHRHAQRFVVRAFVHLDGAIRPFVQFLVSFFDFARFACRQSRNRHCQNIGDPSLTKISFAYFPLGANHRPFASVEALVPSLVGCVLVQMSLYVCVCTCLCMVCLLSLACSRCCLGCGWFD